MNRTTKHDLDSAVKRYARALKSANIQPTNSKLSFITGSKAYGNSYKLVWIDDAHGGHYPAQGSDGGHVGWTAREACSTIQTMARTIEDLVFLRNN